MKFLLELTITPRVSNPGVQLLLTSADMLSLVVEAIVLKQRLANSGTSLVWKVSIEASLCEMYDVTDENHRLRRAWRCAAVKLILPQRKQC